MDYRATLNLPHTRFKMKANLAQKEPQFLARWEKEDLYGRIQAATKDRPLYILHDGPPYANGHIHLGTSFNKVLKDIILKSKRMAGFHCPPMINSSLVTRSKLLHRKHQTVRSFSAAAKLCLARRSKLIRAREWESPDPFCRDRKQIWPRRHFSIPRRSRQCPLA